jgi:hypothetical protein
MEDKTNSKPNNNGRMNGAKQHTPSITRKLEQMALFFLKITENSPKIPMIEKYLVRLADELMDCLVGSQLAYSTKDIPERYDCLQTVKGHLCFVSSIVHILFEWSKTNKQKVHLLTPSQYADYLKDIGEVDLQLDKWIQKTKGDLKEGRQDVPGQFVDRLSR